MAQTTETFPLPEINWRREPVPAAATAVFRILVAVSVCHLLNDMVQSLVPSIYPILKTSFHLNFSQIGLLSLTYQVVASLLQPFIGLYTDKRPMPYALAVGMCFTMAGTIMLAVAPTFHLLLVAAAVVGAGSAIFHPESSRIARIASGGRHGFAQSFFQVGGNTGTSIGPLLAAFIVLPQGQRGMAWFAIAAALGVLILYFVDAGGGITCSARHRATCTWPNGRLCRAAR